MSKPWSGPAVTKAVAEQRAIHAHKRSPCSICGQVIDYKAGPTDPQRFSVQHVIPRSVRPDLTWDRSNWAPAHMDCNKRQGVKIQVPLGVTSRDW